jgi:TetR/AcrR family transcriptional repressor of nem operon
MGRTRTFEEPAILRAAGEVFRRNGYEGTSIDDLVTALNLHRGSLYNAFGSKRGLFVATLHHHLAALGASPSPSGDTDADEQARALDLLLIAAVERGPVDVEIADLVRATRDRLDRELQTPATTGPAMSALADRLLQRLAGPANP